MPTASAERRFRASMSAASSGSPLGSSTADREAGREQRPAGAPSRGAGPDRGASRADFGANEWLVEELYQRYLADPGSVDRAWWSFFADYQPAQGARAAAAAPSRGQAAPPSPAPPSPPAPAPLSPPSPPEGAAVSRLRGAAARTAANMAASLAVPTATSVRSVPAKLLADNRIVINNHLRRGRGGKVSFTHLIAYAMVAALRDVPEMNDAYAEENGKPAVARPEHVTWAWPSTCRPPTAAGSCWCRTSSAPRNSTSASSGRPTRTWCAGRGPASSPSRTSPGPRSPSPTPARSAPSDRCPG